MDATVIAKALDATGRTTALRIRCCKGHGIVRAWMMPNGQLVALIRGGRQTPEFGVVWDKSEAGQVTAGCKCSGKFAYRFDQAWLYAKALEDGPSIALPPEWAGEGWQYCELDTPNAG